MNWQSGAASQVHHAYAQAKVDVRSDTARVVVTDVLVNDSDSEVKLTYRFPLPNDATVAGFADFRDGKRLEASASSRAEARERFARWVPLPAVDPDDPAYDGRGRHLGLRRHWRGPSWINAAWLVALGLRRLGLDRDAEAMARRAQAVVRAAGLREYYEARSGRGMGARLRLVGARHRHRRPRARPN